MLFLVNSKLLSQSFTVCSSCEINNISRSIENAISGDNIYFKKEIFYEHDIEINKPLTLIGNKTVLDVNSLGNGFIVNSDQVSISGFIINNIKSSFTKDLAGIKGYGINFFSFKNNEFNNPFFAFLIQKSSKGIISDNIINGNSINEISSGNGIHLWHSNNIVVQNNSIYNMRDGIYMEFVDESTINYNICKMNKRYGLHFMFSDQNTFKQNIFDSNEVGVAVMFSKNISISENHFKNNWGMASYGLLLKEIYDTRIENNFFYKNTIGINTEGSSRINYNNNVFENNGWAVKISGGCYKNLFKKNDFLNNTFDVSSIDGQNDNSFEHNYWSNYIGYDLNKDEIGDIPYRPMKLFSYIVNIIPESIILRRSLFIDFLNYSENISPIFTPKDLHDNYPALNKINNDIN